MHKFRLYKEMIDIDYYVYFSKAYFAYNAYLKAKYSGLSDLDKNKKMKEDIAVRNKFRDLIKNTKHFKDNIISLRDIVGQSAITNNGEIINFDSVKIGEHQVIVLFNESYNGVQYFIKALGSERFTFTVGTKQSNQFLFGNLETELTSSRISVPQQNKVRSIITQQVQSYTINLSVEIEKLKNFDSLNLTEVEELSDKLFKGFVEIIYKLRNALFHSEIEPNNDVMRVYKFAYFILRKLIKEIPSR
jgi:hypothetical protein